MGVLEPDFESVAVPSIKINGLKIETAGASEKGPYRPDDQDAWDAFSLDDGSCVLVLADGMGGEADGALAAQVAVQAVRNNVSSAGSDSDLKSAVDDASNAVARVLGLKRGGSTLVIAVITAAGVRIASVGDSRAYVIREGKAVLLTKDHSVAQQLVDGGTPWSQAMKMQGAHALTRAITGQDVRADIVSIDPLQASDRVVLCCDGVWEPLDIDSLESLWSTKSGRSLEEDVADSLKAAIDAGSRDNVTVVAAGALLG